MNQISAHIVADSISPQGHRISTILGVIPRIVLAELNTHRMLSRNSASSRAIPTEKMIQTLKNNPFIPIKWMKEHKGMQGYEYFDDFLSHIQGDLKRNWLKSRDFAIDGALEHIRIGASKQIANRLLEPWMMHTVLITATEWSNFTALRAEENAEIHFQDFAYKVLNVLNESEPKKLAADDWHIPFGDDIDEGKLFNTFGNGIEVLTGEIKVKIAVARAARTSYTVVGTDQKHDYAADIKLHDRLLESGHLSPFEHCAQVMTENEYYNYRKTTGTIEEYKSYSIEAGWCHNFRGFKSYRSMLPNENRQDPRLLKK